MVKLVIYELIPTSQWASFTVPVFKSDGLIRICGNYKQTISWKASRDKYPAPKTEDIVATKLGGFTKLILSKGYQQLVLKPKSRNLLTVNTHKELF